MTEQLLGHLADECECENLSGDCLFCDALLTIKAAKAERDELRRLLMHMVKAYARWTPTRGHIRIEEQERCLAWFDELSKEWWKS
jgi:hypothetical protein